MEVDTFDGLLAEYAKTFPEGAVIVKGLRANTDFENEFQMALINKKINPELDTMFLTASQKYTFLSSSVVKRHGGLDLIEDLEDLVALDDALFVAERHAPCLRHHGIKLVNEFHDFVVHFVSSQSVFRQCR